MLQVASWTSVAFIPSVDDHLQPFSPAWSSRTRPLPVGSQGIQPHPLLSTALWIQREHLQNFWHLSPLPTSYTRGSCLLHTPSCTRANHQQPLHPQEAQRPFAFLGTNGRIQEKIFWVSPRLFFLPIYLYFFSPGVLKFFFSTPKTTVYDGSKVSVVYQP